MPTTMLEVLRWLLWNARALFVNAYLRVTRGSVPYRYVRLTLTGALVEDPARGGLRKLLRGHQRSLPEVVDLLAEAARDSKLEGMLVTIGSLEGGWGQIESLVEGFAGLRSAGKRVVVFLESADARGYVLAAAIADQLVLHPTGSIHWAGIRAEVALFGPALEKLGVDVDLEPVGRFKSAVEPFTRSSLSDDARAALSSLVDDLFEQSCAAVAHGRHKTEAEVAALVDQGPFLAREALAAGLVDKLAFEDEVFVELAGEDSPKALAKLVEPHRYGRLRRRRLRPLRHGQPVRVAWVPVVGAIRSGEGGGVGAAGATSAGVVQALRKARRDESIRAVLLRVDSPGGSALASDVIWREVVRTKHKKPVIVSMGDYAASGGYYVSTPATAVVAAATTLTGSIGVFGGKVSIGRLYRRVGVHKDGYGRGANVALFSESRKFTRGERRKLREHLEDTYRVFLDRVAQGRNTTVEVAESHAQGRVWTGRQALERGLVDATGGLGRALAVLREKAGIPRDQPLELVSMHRSPGLVPWLTEQFVGGGARTARVVEVWMTLATSCTAGEPLVVLPFALRLG